MRAVEPTTTLAAPISLLDRLLEEAAGLGEEARAHLVDVNAQSPSVTTLRVQHEVGVIAACLGYSVAWLLAQKAVLAGEIDAAEPTPVAAQAAVELADPLVVGPMLADLGRRTRTFAARIGRLAAT